jgi:ribose/xylose/arabinose/galactoside ABC-type transport system permease subunit
MIALLVTFYEVSVLSLAALTALVVFHMPRRHPLFKKLRIIFFCALGIFGGVGCGAIVPYIHAYLGVPALILSIPVLGRLGSMFGNRLGLAIKSQHKASGPQTSSTISD